MASQSLITAVIPSLIILLALDLSGEKSIITEYCRIILSFLFHTVWNEYLCNGGKTSVMLAQFGALVLLRLAYTQVMVPLYLIITTRHNLLNLKQRYGSWNIIMGDLSKGDVKLMRDFAKNFISKGMNVLILDCRSAVEVLGGDKEKSQKEEKMRNDVAELFIEDLRQFAGKEENYFYNDEIFDNGDMDSNDGLAKVDIMTLKDISKTEDLCSEITTKLGNIANEGGIGFLVHCFSSNQGNREQTKRLTPGEKLDGTEQFLSVLNLTLPYMIFRGTGAIINICGQYSPFYEKSKNEDSSEARGVAECAFYTQLIRSIHYEYAEHGIDSLAVSLTKQELFDSEIIVQSSLQTLGEDSQLDMKICMYISMLRNFGCLSKWT